MPPHPCGLHCALFRYDIGTFVLLCRRLDSQQTSLKWATTENVVPRWLCVFCFLKGDVKLGFVLSERRGPRRVCGLLHTFIGLHQSG